MQLSYLVDSNAELPDPDTEYTIKQREVSLDKELLQLVQGACKADNLQRALDLTRLMNNPATVDAAAKVAGFYHLPGLQERIAGVKGETERKRSREKRKTIRRSEVYSNGHGAGSSTPAPPSKHFSEFAPRDGKPRRSFGGVNKNRDSTPQSTAGALPSALARSETYIPETPRDESAPPFAFDNDHEESDADLGRTGQRRSRSPENKRKRVPIPGDEENFAPPQMKKRPEEFASIAKGESTNEYGHPKTRSEVPQLKSQNRPRTLSRRNLSPLQIRLQNLPTRSH